MAFISGSPLTNDLQTILQADELRPGDAPSYQLCKTILSFHPLGAKLVDAPTKLAMSQRREITVSKGPEERVRKAFEDEWAKLDVNAQIENLMRISRAYGIGSVAVMVEGEDPEKEIKLQEIWKKNISFNVFDPLNTSGSLILSQNPNDIDFLKSRGSITVQGVTYHRSRVIIKLNEEPIYLEYTGSAFGYVGRSVYQRSLYPLKSYLQTMIADDMVARKAGIIVTKLQQAGSIITQAMAAVAGFKRNVVRDAQTDNVISVGVDEDVTSIDLVNVNGALGESRKNILNNIASGAAMPAILVNEETFAEGFGEGTEDARHVALFIENYRNDMAAIYRFFDNLVQHRAWNPEFFEAVQEDFNDYKKKTYEEAFYEWTEAFSAKWPSLLTEPDSEKSKSDKVKLDAITNLLTTLLPVLDPENKASIVQWAMDNFNSLDTLFQVAMDLDIEALAEYEPPLPDPTGAGGEPAAPGAGLPKSAGKAPPKPAPKPTPKPSGAKKRADSSGEELADLLLRGTLPQNRSH